MTKQQGYLITAAYVLAFIGFYYLRNFLIKKDEKRFKVHSIILEWVNVLIPTALLFSLGTRWIFTDDYLPSQIPTDLTFSTFHLLMIVLTVIGVLIFLKKSAKHKGDQKTYLNGRMNKLDYQLLKFGVALIGIEVFKQIVYLNLFGGPSNYVWSGFPLQYCSLPFYLYVIIPFLKPGTVKDAFYSYVAIFSLLGGVSVMITGGGVFNLIVAISLHTMIWHGTMVVSAIYVGVMTGVGKSFKNFKYALYLFLASLLLIQTVNTTFHLISFAFPPIKAFDGFYINPWATTENVAYISEIRMHLTNYGIHSIFIGLLITIFYGLFVSLGGYLLYRFYQTAAKRNKNKKTSPENPPLAKSK